MIQDFPGGGAPIPQVGEKSIIYNLFAQKFMEMKEFGWGASLAALLGSANDWTLHYNKK